MTALAHVVAYRLRLRPASPQPVRLPRPAVHRLAGLVVAEAMQDRPAGGWLSRRDAGEVLRAYGVEVVPTVGADGRETAADASSVLPFPVVLTAYGTGGTEAGNLRKRGRRGPPQAAAVVTRLRSPAEVRLAARELRDRLGTDIHDFGLQPQLHRARRWPCSAAGARAGGPWWDSASSEGTGSRSPEGTGADDSPQDLSDACRPAVGAGPGGRGGGHCPRARRADGVRACGPAAVAGGRARRARGPPRARLGAPARRRGRSRRWSCGPSSSTGTTLWWPPPGSVSEPPRAGNRSPLLRRMPG